MIKRFVLLLALVGSFHSMTLMAIENKPIDINIADQSQLESIKGIGPKHVKTILEERQKNGPFKDEEDFKNRVKGIGDKSLAKLKANGLNIGKLKSDLQNERKNKNNE